MKRLEVNLCLNRVDSRRVGELVEDNHRLYFEYDSDFLNSPFLLSPFKLPPKPGLLEHRERSFGPLFGLFDDSLPDGWGLLLMDRVFRQKGIDPAGVSVLDRLSYLGEHTMGALTYQPALNADDSPDAQILSLHDLAGQAYQLLSGDVRDVLPLLCRVGGSPGGARPKVLVGINGDSVISGESDLPDGYEHWMVKFFSREECRDEGRVESAYAAMAKTAAIAMPPTRLFETREGEAFFGVKRFDRDENSRFHVHTFGNMIHSNFRIPSCDYEMLLRVTRLLTKNHCDVVMAFRLMIFNILSCNRDDHVKNFSFIMDHGGVWHFSPAYDLTFSSGPGGEHSMTVAGEGRAPQKSRVLELAAGCGIEKRAAVEIIDEVASVISQWKKFASAAGVGPRGVNEISTKMHAQMKLFR